MQENESRRHRLLCIALVLAAFYVLSHIGNLSRELTNEESVFMLPGRHLFEGKGFEGYLGERLDGGPARFNPFHKPPLTSVLLGAFSFLSPDGITGARLVPFLTGLFVVLMPFLLTGQWVPSLILMIAPFLYAASSHMQTDPTVGLLGYSSVLVYWYQVHQGRRSLGWLIAGCVVLWTGKIEIAVIAGAASLASLLILPRAARLASFKDLVVANVVGGLGFVLLSWILGLTANYPFRDSVGFVVDTILRISKGLSDSSLREPYGLWRAFRIFGGFTLIAILAVPLIGLWWKRSEQAALRAVGVCLAFVVVPILVYGIGGYAGDMFPRYLLILFPPLALAAGIALQGSSRQLRALRWAVAIGTIFVIGPAFSQIFREKGVVTVARGSMGYAAATQVARAHTGPDEWILGGERALWYARDRRWLVLETFESYPESQPKAFALFPKVKAAVLPSYIADPKAEGFLAKKLYPALLATGAFQRIDMGEISVWIRTSSSSEGSTR